MSSSASAFSLKLPSIDQKEMHVFSIEEQNTLEAICISSSDFSSFKNIVKRQPEQFIYKVNSSSAGSFYADELLLSQAIDDAMVVVKNHAKI